MIHETTGSRSWTLALTSLAFFMVALDMLVVISALPAIRRDVWTAVTERRAAWQTGSPGDRGR